MQQDRLFRLALEAMHFHAVFVPGQGWHLSVMARRGDESWPDAYQAHYSHLSTDELVQVFCEEAAALFP